MEEVEGQPHELDRVESQKRNRGFVTIKVSKISLSASLAAAVAGFLIGTLIGGRAALPE